MGQHSHNAFFREFQFNLFDSVKLQKLTALDIPGRVYILELHHAK